MGQSTKLHAPQRPIDEPGPERASVQARPLVQAGDSFWAPDEPVTIHLQRPQLDFAGEKLRTAWTRDLLAGVLDYKARPDLTARMPAFPAQAEDIARGLAAQHGFPPINEARPPIDTDLAAAGRKLALSDDLFRCNSCHSVGAEGPLAGADTETINFAHIPERLRRGYFERFTLDPQRILPGTQMPQYAAASLPSQALIDADDTTKRSFAKLLLRNSPTSSIPHILDGDTATTGLVLGRQFDAIWHFMRSLADQDSAATAGLDPD